MTSRCSYSKRAMSLHLNHSILLDINEIINSPACVNFEVTHKALVRVVCSSHPNNAVIQKACQTINHRVAEFTPLHQLQIALTYCTDFHTYLDNPDMDEAVQDCEASIRAWILSDDVVIEYQLNRQPFIDALCRYSNWSDEA
ncbi:hypothetical protein ACPV54_26205 [Vibrio mediterranei]